MFRLQKTADLAGDAPTGRLGYDTVIEAAVKRFQHRHGLTADGLVGNRTRAELNIPVERRITNLQLNMERWRWLPDSLGDRYLMVNIPAFALHVVDAARRIDTMRVIVGKTRRQTPIISGNMTYLEFNPYWNIPPKIARRDILPKVIGDPAYLVRQGIRIFDSWDSQALEVDPAQHTVGATYPPGIFPTACGRTPRCECPGAGQIHISQPSQRIYPRHTRQSPLRSTGTPAFHPAASG
jgi:murein L,D-transpeptidase YcbB/YkuD